MRVEKPMVVECDTCPVRGLRCEDCVVTAFAGLPVVTLAEGELPLDTAERRAVGRLVAAGLVAPEVADGLVARREPWGGTAASRRAAAG